ncbi:MAG: hypothetical protein R2909_22920 [Gemmatimonadales bacterium]
MSWVALAHLRWHGFIGLCWHDGVIIAVPPVPTPKMPHITFNVLNGLFLGSLPSVPTRGALFGADAPGKTVGPLGIPFMGRTTDAGFITPHVSIPPNNAMLPLTILLGGSESMLGSSQVKIKCTNLIFGTDEQDMAACTIPYIPLSTNFGCNDPLFVPLDMVISPNTVMVGLTLADLFNMLLDLLIAALIEGLMFLGGAAVSKGIKKVKAKRAAKKMGKVSAAGSEAYEKALKQAELDEVLKDGLRKQRAKATGSPAPPPKPKKLLEKRAKKAGDEAWHKAFKEEFGQKPPGKVRQYLDKVFQKRPEVVGRMSAAARTLIKSLGEEFVSTVMGEGAENLVDGHRPQASTTQVREGETVLAGAGETENG